MSKLLVCLSLYLRPINKNTLSMPTIGIFFSLFIFSISSWANNPLPEMLTFTADVEKVSAGRNVTFSWSKDANAPSTSKYNFYLQEYSNSGLYLSKTVDTSTVLQLNDVGQQQFWVEACVNNKCGTALSVTVDVLDVPRQVTSLSTDGSNYAVGSFINLIWDAPSPFNGDITYTVEVLNHPLLSVPMGEAISNRYEDIVDTSFSYQADFSGQHYIYVTACNELDDCGINFVCNELGCTVDNPSLVLDVEPNEQPIITSSPSTEIAAGQSYAYQVSASDADGDTLSYDLLTSPISMTIDQSSGLISWTPTDSDIGTHPINIEVYDGRDGSSTQSYNLIVKEGQVGEIPPNPAEIAPTLSLTATTSMFDAVSFLFSGENPIQTGADVSTFREEHVAVVRGRVMAKDNTPLSGVEIVIKGHDEYGKTYSRTDGWFDLAINGGDVVTVEYKKEGFLPIQRQIQSPWRDYVLVDDVVMLTLDPIVTTIDLSSSLDMQVAQGSIQADLDGERQATILFPKGLTATMTLPNGDEQPLSVLNVRATEYTVGENGSNAMPGELPTFSGYTYAVELSVDEAIEAGATTVTFNQEIPLYVDNFLEFPVGGIVPVGWYDFETSSWVPSKNGRIIKILNITDGKAALDIDGTGTIASTESLNTLGITELELKQLAITFNEGDSLWRSPISHLTPWDCNWPFGPPNDAELPEVEDPMVDTELTLEPENSDYCPGCIINAQSQSLGEDINVVGVPYQLHYRSERTAGYKSGRVITVPLLKNVIPNSLKSIEVNIEIAGQVFTQHYTPSLGLEATFEWDGNNAYGQILYNAYALVNINYVYPAEYYPAPRDFEASFARITDSLEPLKITADETNRLVRLTKEYKIKLRSSKNLLLSTANIGGWSITPHHSYDPSAGLLMEGNGSTYITQQIYRRETIHIAGNRDGWNYGDGEKATNVGIGTNIDGMDTDNKGNIYFKTGAYIRKINPQGIITTIAGNGIDGYSGDGGPATSASIPISYGRGNLTVHNDNIYFSDTQGMRKIDSSGIISSVMGVYDDCNEEGVGEVESSSGLCLIKPFSSAISSDGTIYFSNYYKIFMLMSDGVIYHVAGIDDGGNDRENILATEASIRGVEKLHIGEDGSIYYFENHNGRIRKIGNDGIVNTIAGGGDLYIDEYNGKLATSANLFRVLGNFDVDSKGNILFLLQGKLILINTSGIISIIDENNSFPGYFSGYNPLRDIAIDPDDNLYFVNFSRSMIYKNSLNVLPAEKNTDRLVPSKDGKELYTFSAEGRHLKTQDTVTGSILNSFNYTTQGYLNEIIDVNGQTTSFIRDSEGNVESIVSPDGQSSDLVTNHNGYLSSISNPLDHTINFEYKDNGLMTKIIDALGSENSFEYDSFGRFISDMNPEGGGWTISKSRGELGGPNSIVTMTTGENRNYVFETGVLPSGEKYKKNIATDGSETEEYYLFRGRQNTYLPNGNIISKQFGKDTRFGAFIPKIKNYSIMTPGGLYNTFSFNESVSLAVENDKLSHTSLIRQYSINGQNHISQFDASTKKWVHTSPEGRVRTELMDDAGRVFGMSFNELAQSILAYTPEGRVSAIVQGSGVDSRETSFNYYSSGIQKGFLQSITDAADRETSFTYDAAGRLLTQLLPNGNEINFNYDANGNITSITPANDETHSYEYTALDKTSSYIPPSVPEIATPTTEYSYNLDKQLELITLPNGQVVDHIYHATKGHKIETQIPRGSFYYSYSGTSGQVEQVTAPDSSTIKYTYDGSLVLSAELTGDISGKVSQTYNNEFKVTQRCIDASDCINFNYDNDMLMTQAGALTINRAVQKGGLITGTQLGSITTSYTYNDFGEPLSETANDASLYSVNYTRDNLGRITQKTETVQGNTTTFDYEYNLLGQLSNIKTNGAQTTSYGYDGNGNRTHINDASVASFDAQDRLKQYGDNLYTYTDNGDLVSKTNSVTSKTNLYHYDVLGNLISAAIPDESSSETVQVEYLIDAQNRRVGKKINDVLVQGFLYKDQLNPIAELDGDGNIVSRFIYGSKAFVPDYMSKAGKTYRIISDHLGSPRLVIDVSDNSVIQRIDYDVWGNITLDTNPGFQPFGFAGGLYDQHTKLTRFGARDYDAEIGRWTTKDPIGLNGGLNIYGYVGAEPINRVDPFGLVNPMLAGCLVGAAAQGGVGFGRDIYNYFTADGETIGCDGSSNGKNLGDIFSNLGGNMLGGCLAGAIMGMGVGIPTTVKADILRTITASMLDASVTLSSVFGG